jgi:Mg2+ and Co2+ transporter CorA
VRGITLNQEPAIKKDIGFCVAGQYHAEDMKKEFNNTFLFDRNDFLPSKILHVFDFNKASRESKDYLKKIDAEIGDYFREKVPLTYFLGTIIKYLIFFAISLPLFVLHPKRYSVFIISTMRTIHDLFFMEIFYNHYHVKVHITRDDYSHCHIVRTVVINERNGKTIGFMHGAMPVHRNIYAYIYLNSYCIWGKANEMFQKHLFKHVDKLEIIGAYRNDYVYNYVPGSETGEIESLRKTIN